MSRSESIASGGSDIKRNRRQSWGDGKAIPAKAIQPVVVKKVEKASRSTIPVVCWRTCYEVYSPSDTQLSGEVEKCALKEVRAYMVPKYETLLEVALERDPSLI